MTQPLLIKTIVKEFNLKVLLGTKKDLLKPILKLGVNRGAMELAGINTGDRMNRIVIMGAKESIYLSSLNNAECEKRTDAFFKLNPFCIILSNNFRLNSIFMKAACRYKTIVLSSTEKTYIIIFQLLPFINRHLAKRVELHGTVVSIYGEGVLLIGKSGIGKSELALALVQNGHNFLADDRILVYNDGLNLVGECPDSIKNLIEIRGIGIIDLAKMYGFHSIIRSTNINLIIELIATKKINNFERVNSNTHTKVIQNKKIMHYKIPVTTGRNLTGIIEATVAAYKLRKQGINSVQEIRRRISKLIRANANSNSLET